MAEHSCKLQTHDKFPNYIIQTRFTLFRSIVQKSFAARRNSNGFHYRMNLNWNASDSETFLNSISNANISNDQNLCNHFHFDSLKLMQELMSYFEMLEKLWKDLNEWQLHSSVSIKLTGNRQTEWNVCKRKVKVELVNIF